MQNESNTLTYDQETQLAQTFRPNAYIGLAVNKVRNFIKNDKVQIIANEDLRLALMNSKIDIDYVVSTRKKVVNQGIKKNNLNAVNVALDRLEDHLGLNQKVKVRETRIDSNLTDNFNEAKKQTRKITIQQEINTQNEEKTRQNTEEDAKTE